MCDQRVTWLSASDLSLCLHSGGSGGHRGPSVLRATRASASAKPYHQCPSQLGLPCTVFTNIKLQQDDLSLSPSLSLTHPNPHSHTHTHKHTHTHTLSLVRGFALATRTDCVAYPERKLQHHTQLDLTSHA